MAVFAILQTEKVVQVGDRTRLDASQSFVNDDETIALIQIQPTPFVDPITVPLDAPFLDWVYTDPGDVTALVIVTGDTSAPEGTAELTVLSAEEDALFSSDTDLLAQEPTIRTLLPEGKSSFLNVHREAQSLIMDSLNRKVQATTYLEPDAVGDKREVKEWSKYLTLQLIFEGSVNAADDVFAVKSRKYASLADQAGERSFIALDLNGDGVISDSEKKTSFGSVSMVRK